MYISSGKRTISYRHTNRIACIARSFSSVMVDFKHASLECNVDFQAADCLRLRMHRLARECGVWHFLLG